MRKTSTEKPKLRRTGRRRTVIQSDSEEEIDREEEMERLGEESFSPIHDDFYGSSPKDDRPNNIEVLSLEDVKATFNTDDEEESNSDKKSDKIEDIKDEPEPNLPVKIEMKKDMIEELSLGEAVKKLNDSNESIKIEPEKPESPEKMTSESQEIGFNQNSKIYTL